MAAHEKFAFRGKDAFLRKIRALGLDIPFAEDITPLLDPVVISGRRVPNRLAVLPMECADAAEDGAPTERTVRRYEGYAAGGAGMIWVEATAVRRDGRSNPRQLMLSEETEGTFRRLVDTARGAAEAAHGGRERPLLVLQLTHSGRFAKPDGAPAPLIVHHSPALDPLHGLPADYPVLADDTLAEIQDDLVNAADLAASAGFDAVDIKACHGYLVSELLAAFTREDSRYGGPFENRARFLLETVRRIRDETPGLLVTSRLSAADMVPFPHGFGMNPEHPEKADLREVKALVRKLAAAGVGFLALSLGIPAWRPYYGRPFDVPVAGGNVPGEHPLQGVARHLTLAAALQRAFPKTPIVGAGYSWLRGFFPNVGAAMVAAGWTSVIGQGRGALAYPDFPRDLQERGRLDPRKVCTTCSQCSGLLRAQQPVWCTVRSGKH